MNMRSQILAGLFSTSLALTAVPLFAASDLPPELPQGYTSWHHQVSLACSVKKAGGGVRGHTLDLFIKPEQTQFRSVQVERLDGEAYLVAHFRSVPSDFGNTLSTFVYFLREDGRWVKYTASPVTAETRKEMLARAEAKYLKPRGITTEAIKTCIRNGNEQ